MVDENEKKAPQEGKEGEEEPTYEENKGLDKTMMDIDSKQFTEKKRSEKKESTPSEEEKESIEDMLKKKKSLLRRLGLKKIFGKKK